MFLQVMVQLVVKTVVQTTVSTVTRHYVEQLLPTKDRKSEVK